MLKKILFLALTSWSLTVSAQKSFTINGDVKGTSPGDKIYLVYLDGSGTRDSTTVSGGSFNFKGSLKEPLKAGLYLNKWRATQGEVLNGLTFYLEPATIGVTGPGTLREAVISGSPINDEDKTLKTLTRQIDDQLTGINAEYSRLTTEQKKDSRLTEELAGKYKRIAAELPPILLKYAHSHPESFISLVAIGRIANDDDQRAAAENAFRNLSIDLKNTKAGIKLASGFEIAKKTAIGMTAVDFTQNDVSGRAVKLSDFRGKYVLLDFWASLAGPSRAEHRNLVSAYQIFKDRGFTILSVSLDMAGQRDKWIQAIEKDGMTWTQVSDLKSWDNEVAVQYGIRAIPSNFLIDPAGKIIAKDLRGESLQKKLSEVLNKTTENITVTPTKPDNIPPVIAIIDPEITRGLKVVQSNSKVVVSGTAIDESGIKTVEVNGVIAAINGTGNFFASIPLVIGDNKLVVKATDNNSNTAVYDFVITRNSGTVTNPQPVAVVPVNPVVVTASSEGKYYALVIGIQDYTDESIPDLDQPVADARSLQGILISNYTFDRENVSLLANPTRSEIFRALETLSRKIKKEDNVLIFYAGHGLWDAGRKQGYWFPADAGRDDRASWVTNADLKEYISAIPSRHTLLITDACFAGSIFKSRAILTGAPRAIKELYELPSRKAMTSGTLKEVPDKSVFIEYLVKRLTQNEAKFLSAERLYSSFRDAVINNSANGQVPQYGEIKEAGDEGGDFIFIKK